jgi:DNA processing protein
MNAADDDEEFEAWFRLLQAPGLGRASARGLLAAFGSAPAVLRAAPAQWRAVAGAAAAAALARREPEIEERLRSARAWLGAAPRRQVFTLGDPGYPAALLSTEDPPLMLFVEGRAELLSAPALAVVGSRHPTPQGAANAREFASHLSAEGWVIVSGLAQGIDGAAHEGALEGRGGTVAVIGTGPDIAYPRQHAALARRIAEAGALVSEFAPGTPPLAENFPLRNRIIAGLGRGTLVVEAALQSGSLITARLAAEAGREVFAIPGSIHSPQSRGCHALIRQGAKLVESGADILEELRPSGGAPDDRPASPASPAGRRPRAARPRDADASTPPEDADASQGGGADGLLEALGHDPVTLDALGARTGLPAGLLGARLLELELSGEVARLPGGLFQRLGRG